MPEQDLKVIRENAVKMREFLDVWNYVVDSVDTIEANKGFLKMNTAKRNELKGNQQAILSIQANIVKENKTLAAVKVKVVNLNEYLESGYKQKEKEQQRELDALRISEKKLIDKSLEGSRKQLKTANEELKDVWSKIDSARAELQSIQYGIRSILVPVE